jgi:hypothetical protein
LDRGAKSADCDKVAHDRPFLNESLSIHGKSARILADSLTLPYNWRQDEIFADSDGDGEVRIPLSEPPPIKFMAITVELSSGRFGVLTPQGSPAREVALPAHSLLAGPGDRLDRLDYQSSYLELLLVRPPDGVWRLTTGDGTPSDDGPSSDGRVLTSPRFLLPVDDGMGPPDQYEVGDLIFGVSPMTMPMQYFAARIVRD